MKLWAGWSGVRIPAGATVFLLNIRPVLKPNEPSIQWVSQTITPRRWQQDWLQHDVDHSVCLAVRLRTNAAKPLLPPHGLNCMDRDITAWFVVNCVRSLIPIPKDSGVLLKFYDFSTPLPNHWLAS